MEWHDLTHRIDADTPRLPFLDEPRVASLEDPLLAASELTIATHAGTHVEAPRHRFSDGAGIDAYPPGRFLCEAVAWSPGAGARAPIEAADLEDVLASLAPGDALLVHTGWDDHAGTDRYEDHPYLTPGAAEAVANADASWVGLDTPTPENPAALADEPDPADPEAFPVHTALLGADVLVAENLTNVGSVATSDGARVDAAALPLPIGDGDAAPARVAAREIEGRGRTTGVR
ncbi:MAG: cyclase family protein [Haloferacaceae archaeon]